MSTQNLSVLETPEARELIFHIIKEYEISANRKDNIGIDYNREILERIYNIEKRSNRIEKRLYKLESELKYQRELMEARFVAAEREAELRHQFQREELNIRFLEVDKRFDDMKEDMDRRFSDVREDMDRRFSDVREDMDKRFEEVNKRFDMVNVRITQIFVAIGLAVAVLGTLMTYFQFFLK